MNEKLAEGVSSAPLETERMEQQDESPDRSFRRRISSRSVLSMFWRHFLNILLVSWLLLLFLVSTWSVVGSLSAHVYQGQFSKLLNSQTTKEKEHLFISYLKLRDAIDVFRDDRESRLERKSNNQETAQPSGAQPSNNVDKQFGDIKEILEEINDKEYDTDLLNLARSGDSLERICLPDFRGGDAYCLSDFIQVPGQLLILLLTLSMGVLGSLMRITRNFFDRQPDEEELLSWYIFRPLLGAITALAVLILLKAGQLTITNASIGAEHDNINPFFISFIAIISGFLSVQAHDRIRRAGAAIFGTSRRPPVNRWLVKSRAKNIGSKDLSSLASYLGVPDEKVKKWFDLDEAVPESAQPIVGAWLDEPQQTLFTDLKPENKKRTTAETRAISEIKERPEDKRQPQYHSSDTLRKAGNSMERSKQDSIEEPQEKDRWLMLEQAQELIKSRKLAGLARHARVEVETVQAWMDNREAVPPKYQPIIEAWLDSSSGLFTDEEPRPREDDAVPRD